MIKVFAINDKCSAITTNATQEGNIQKIFTTLSNLEHLKTTCRLDSNQDNAKDSIIYQLGNCQDINKFDFSTIAVKLLESESRKDGNRNKNIPEGLLFISYQDRQNFQILKLESHDVIDQQTFEPKKQLINEKNYFKAMVFCGDYENIEITDKSSKASKYWYKKFLSLELKNNSEKSTKELLKLVSTKNLFKEQFYESPDWNNIERILFTNLEEKTFDKDHLYDQLVSSELVNVASLDELYSDDTKGLDSQFELDKTLVNKFLKKTIQVTSRISITSSNIRHSIKSGNIKFNKDKLEITIEIEKDYLEEIEGAIHG